LKKLSDTINLPVSMPQTHTFSDLIRAALQQEFSGWDFSFLNGRLIEAPLPWDYRQIAWERSRHAGALLDIGTGGGEFLSGLAPLPRLTLASENYPPNVPIAAARLLPLGAPVVWAYEMQLPFADGSFDLIINRHAGYSEAEVFSLLRPGGRYLTQQVGGRNQFELNAWLQDQPDFMYAHWTLDYARPRLEEAGFVILSAEEGFPETVFTDIGALVFYLKVISWQIADFSVEKYQERLLALHEKMQAEGRLVTHAHRFLIEALRP
jgi:SAM-dependent methyltransferase